jgi:hypothetical protein
MQRPTAVTVFGVLNLVFGGLGLLCTPISLIMLFYQAQQGNPMSRILDENAAYRVYLIAAAVAGVLAALVLIAAGIGLLQMKSWARLTSIGYAIFGIVTGVVAIIVNVVFIFGPMMTQARDGGPEAAAAIGGLVGGMAGGCFGLVYPILLLIFMTRPKIRNAFLPQNVPPIL